MVSKRKNRRPLLSAVLFAAIGLSGCAMPGEKKPVDTGGKYKVDCSGRMGSWADCAEEASEICGENRYDVIWRSTRREPFRKMTIICRDRQRLIDPRDAERGR